jgi:hypothetical protein
MCFAPAQRCRRMERPPRRYGIRTKEEAKWAIRGVTGARRKTVGSRLLSRGCLGETSVAYGGTIAATDPLERK